MSSSHRSCSAPVIVRLGSSDVESGGSQPPVAGLVVPELPRVQHAQIGGAAVPEMPVQADRRSVGGLVQPQRHVFPIRPEAVGPPYQELVVRQTVLGDVVGPVPLHLVVVQGHHPRRGRMRGLQVGVGAVECVPGAVLVQREDLTGEVDRHSLIAHTGRRTDTDLVDVVAEEQHHVVVPLYDVLIRRVVPVVEGLARRDRHRHRGLLGRCWRRASTSDRTELALGAEAVEVVPPGPQTAYVDVHGVGVLRPSVRRPTSYHSAERLVLGDLPVDVHRAVVHPAERLQRTRRETRPDHHGVRHRIAGRDAQGEQRAVVGAMRYSYCIKAEVEAREVAGEGESGGGAGRGEEAAAGGHVTEYRAVVTRRSSDAFRLLQQGKEGPG